MKIGIDIRTTQADSGARGIGKYVYDLLEGLAEQEPDNDYRLIAVPDRPLPERLRRLPSSFKTVPLPTRFLGEYFWAQPIRAAWRVKYLRARMEQGRALARLAAREGLDALHQPCAVDFQFFPSCRPPCRFIQTFHDAIPMVLSELFLPNWPISQRYVYQLQTDALKSADAIAAISESAREDAIRYFGVPEDKIQVVYNSVAPEFAQPVSEARLAETLAKIGIHAPYFLFCSAPDHTKNLKRIFEAFGKFSKQTGYAAQLAMVTSDIPELRLYAFDAGLSRRETIFTGFVSDTDLVALFSGATALLSPSLYEGFGLPAGQAMRAGVPVIASDRSAQPEVVGDAGLLVDPYDVDAIAEAMLRLWNDPALRMKLSERGRRRAQLFDSRIQAQAMLAMYRNEPIPREAHAPLALASSSTRPLAQ